MAGKYNHLTIIIMEQINRVELRGMVGTVKVFNQQDGTAPFVRLSVVTKRVFYQQSTGTDVVESSWHSVVATEGPGCPDLSSLQKGDYVHIIGRLRYNRYTGTDGQDKMGTDIVASQVEKETDAAEASF